ICTYYFFFFQAEDGIRDFHVTGVQTCALPISPDQNAASKWLASVAARAITERLARMMAQDASEAMASIASTICTTRLASITRWKIGRASCRERGWIAGGPGAM